jgi:DNA polymerase III delta prime subunit
MLNASIPYLIIGNKDKAEQECIKFLCEIYKENMHNLIKKKEHPSCLWCYPISSLYKKQDLDEAIYYLSLNHNEIPFTLIITEADRLSLIVSQSLLKLLEDMSENTYIFLLTEVIAKIPDTIISRCIKFNFKNETSNIEELKNIFLDKFINLSIDPNDIDLEIDKNKIDEINSKILTEELYIYLFNKKKIDLAEKILNLSKNEIFPGTQKMYWKLIFMILNNDF